MLLENFDETRKYKLRLIPEEHWSSYFTVKSGPLNYCNEKLQLKLIDRLRATHWTPPDYWQTIPWTGNGHSQLPLAELGKPSSTIDLLSTGSNFHCLTYDLQPQASQGQPCQNQGQMVQTDGRTHTDAAKPIISPAMRLITNHVILRHSMWNFKRVVHVASIITTNFQNGIAFHG